MISAGLVAPTRDQAKIKDLVSSINATQDKLLISFKAVFIPDIPNKDLGFEP